MVRSRGMITNQILTIHLNEARRRFTEKFRNREELKRLIAAIISHPRIKALKLKPSPKRLALFFQDKTILTEIMRYIDIIENGIPAKSKNKAVNSSRIDSQKFERLLECGVFMADDATQADIDKLCEINPGHPPRYRSANLKREDMDYVAPITELAWIRYINLFYCKLHPELKSDLAKFDAVIGRMQNFFQSAKRYKAPNNEKIYFLQKYSKSEVMCFDSATEPLRFIVLENKPHQVISISPTGDLRQLSWAKNGKIIGKILAIPDDHIPINTYKTNKK